MPDLGDAIGGFLGRLHENLQPDSIRLQQQAIQQQQIQTRENSLSSLAQQGVLNPKDPTFQAQTQGLDPHLIATYVSQSNAVKSDRDKFTKAAGEELKNGNIKDPKFIAGLMKLAAQYPASAPALKPLIDAWGKNQEIETKGEEARKTQKPKLDADIQGKQISAKARTDSATTTANAANARNDATIAQRDRAAGNRAEAGHGKAFSAAMKGLTTAIPAAVKAEAALAGTGQAVIDGHNMAALTSPVKDTDFDALSRTGLAFQAPSGKGWVAGVDGWMHAALGADPQSNKFYDKLAKQHGAYNAIKALNGLGVLSDDLTQKIIDQYHRMSIQFNPQAPDTSGTDSGVEPTPEGSDTGAAEPEAAPAADEEPKD